MKKNMFRLLAAVPAIILAMSITAASLAESTVDVIMNAGTTQAFSDEPVSDADLETILRAGLAAPSAINQQPWYLVAVCDPAVMEQLSGGGFGGAPSFGGQGMPSFDGQNMPGGDFSGFGGAPGGMPEGFQPPAGGVPGGMSSGGAKAGLGDSPVAIIIYMNGNTSSPNPSFDCGLAAQNMYIAAASLGYGAKIVSSSASTLNGADHDAYCELLGVDTSLQAVAVLLIGKPDTAVDAVSGATTRNAPETMTTVIR